MKAVTVAHDINIADSKPQSLPENKSDDNFRTPLIVVFAAPAGLSAVADPGFGQGRGQGDKTGPPDPDGPSSFNGAS